MEAVYVNNTGNVGIGTNNPQAKLQIINQPQDSNGNTLVLGPNDLRLGYHQNYAWIQSHSSKPLYINPGGNNISLNTSAGNVGIGTANPQAKLHVAGDATVNGDLRMGGNDFVMLGNDRGDGGRAMVHGGGDSLVLNFANDFPGGTHVDSSLNVNGQFRLSGRSPVVIRRFQNIGNDADIPTGMYNDYQCVATGWSVNFEVAELTHSDVWAVWTHLVGDQWYVRVQFANEGDAENPDVDILCFRNEMVEWSGEPQWLNQPD